MKIITFSIICIFILFVSSKINGQVDRALDSTYIWFDNIIGQTNSGIFKGVAYDESFNVINERHQFFKDSDFLLGSMIYDRQPYFELELKYDVYHDNLLIRNEDMMALSVMIFDKDKITDFNIDGHKFENLSLAKTKVRLSGFFEVLLKTDSIALYKKYQNKLFTRTDEKIAYHEFKEMHVYYIHYDNKYYKLKNAKDLNAIFPKLKNALKDIRSLHESMRKSDSDTYMKSILTDLVSILSTNAIHGL